MGNKSKVTLIVFGLALLLAFIQVHHIFLIFSASLNENIDAAIGITTGHPHWRVYQNRILGPYLLKDLASLSSGDYLGAYTIMMIAILAVAGYQAWLIGRKLGGERTGWFGLVVLHLTFALQLSKPWLYVWDLLGLNIFLAFVYFVVSGRPWYWFVALFAIAILNRESGQFIALWLILEPACRWIIRRPLSKSDSITLAASGVLCIVTGQWIIDYLRTALLVEEVGFNVVGRIPPEYGANYWWTLPRNYQLLQYIFHSRSLVEFISISLPFVMFIAVIFFAAILVYRELRYLALSITFITATVSMLMFSFLAETRIYIESIPLVITASCLLFHTKGLLRTNNNIGTL